jgi:hypothetical protein
MEGNSQFLQCSIYEECGVDFVLSIIVLDYSIALADTFTIKK